MRHKPACVVSLEDNLEELHRRQLLESLRPHILHSEAEKARNAPITLDDLKALCRQWKMDQRRNFWRMHPTQHDIVSALQDYVKENIRYSSTASSVAVSTIVASEKDENILSKTPLPPDHTKSSKEISPRAKNPDYFIHQDVSGRDGNGKALVLQSRFFSYPSHVSIVKNTALKLHVTRNTKKTPEKKEKPSKTTQNAQMLANGRTPINSLQEITGLCLLRESMNLETTSGVMKHRTLAGHLVRYSARADADFHLLPVKAVLIFLSVASSNDPLAVTRGLIALSNICSDSYVRSVLLKNGELQSITAFSSTIDGHWFSTLIFYYYSCDVDLEETASIIVLAVRRVISESISMRMLCIDTLNNVLFSSERFLAIELIITTTRLLTSEIAQLDNAVSLANCILNVMSNVCGLPQVHVLLLENGFLNMVTQMHLIAVDTNTSASKLIDQRLSDLMLAFLHEPEIADNLLQFAFIEFMADTLGDTTPHALNALCRCAAILSQSASYANHFRCESPVMPRIHNALKTLTMNSFTKQNFVFISAYFSNVCRYAPDTDMLEIGMEILPDLIRILKYYDSNGIGRMAVQSIQNLLVDDDLRLKFADVLITPLSIIIETHEDVSSVDAVFNLALNETCLSMLVDSNVHTILFSKLNTSSVSFRCECLQTLMNLVTDSRCLKFLAQNNIMHILHELVISEEMLWLDASRLVRVIVVLSSDQLVEKDIEIVLEILSHICGASTHVDIIIECSVILAQLSVLIPDFTSMDTVIKAIISISDSSSVMESVANLLFNVSCTTPSILIADTFYLNFMIQMMRTGSCTIQKSIGGALQSLCCHESCGNILMKYNLLSDFIVIALLLCTTPEIQCICNQSLCNLFSHESLRDFLLNSDVCWAMMSLSRNNGSEVRLPTASVFHNLSCTSENVFLLRKNLVLHFCHEMVSNTDNATDVLHGYVNAGLNIVLQLHKQLTPTELRHAWSIAVDVITFHSESSLCLQSIRLLLKVTEVNLEYGVQEFIACKVDELLFSSSRVWTRDPATVVDLTRFVVLLSNYIPFVKAIKWSVIQLMLETILKSSTGVLPEAMQNMTLVMFNYSNHSDNSLAYLDSYCFGSLALYTFTSPLRTHESRDILSAIMLWMIVSELHTLNGEFSSLVTTDFMRAVFSQCHANAHSSKLPNILRLTQISITNLDTAACMIDSGLFQYLSSEVLHSKSVSRQVQESCGVFLLNLSCQVPLRSKIADAEGISEFVLALLDTLDEDVCLHMGVSLFYLAEGYLSDDVQLSPQFVQNIATEIVALNRKHEGIATLSKKLLGLVLDRYSGSAGIHPTHVIGMYQSMQAEKKLTVNDFLMNLKHLDRTHPAVVPHDVISNPGLLMYSSTSRLNKFIDSNATFTTSFAGERCLMDVSLLLKVAANTSTILSTAKRFTGVEITPGPTKNVYSKVLKLYPRIFIDKDEAVGLPLQALAVQEDTQMKINRLRKFNRQINSSTEAPMESAKTQYIERRRDSVVRTASSKSDRKLTTSNDCADEDVEEDSAVEVNVPPPLVRQQTRLEQFRSSRGLKDAKFLASIIGAREEDVVADLTLSPASRRKPSFMNCNSKRELLLAGAYSIRDIHTDEKELMEELRQEESGDVLDNSNTIVAKSDAHGGSKAEEVSQAPMRGEVLKQNEIIQNQTVEIEIPFENLVFDQSEAGPAYGDVSPDVPEQTGEEEDEYEEEEYGDDDE